MRRERCWLVSTLPLSKSSFVDHFPSLRIVTELTSPHRISHLMKRIDTLVWTPHMDECVQELSRQRECEGDDLLIALVKIQLIVEQLTRAIWQSLDSTPPAFFMAALQSQLTDLKAKLPTHLLNNSTLAQLHNP